MMYICALQPSDKAKIKMTQTNTEATKAAAQRFLKGAGYALDIKKTREGVWTAIPNVDTSQVTECLIRYVPPADVFSEQIQKLREASGGKADLKFFKSAVQKTLESVCLGFRSTIPAAYLAGQDADPIQTLKEAFPTLPESEITVEYDSIETDIAVAYQIPYLIQTNADGEGVLIPYSQDGIKTAMSMFGYEPFISLMQKATEGSTFKKS